MAQFHWNYIYPTGNLYKAYEQYLQNTEYVNDIKDCINYNSNGIKFLLETSNINTSNIDSSIKSVSGKLDRGFEMMEGYLSSIDMEVNKLSSELSSMSSMLDWKLSALIEGQKITNRILGNIADLLKIPDTQLERVYYIEEGLKFLKNALIENSKSDFFKEAYNSFNIALDRESKDYVSLNKIGFIHLYSIPFLDFAKSEEYFRKSIRYSDAEANVGGTNTSNTLNPFNSDFNLKANIHLISSVESMLYCARACALQNKLDEAINLCTNAYSKVPTFLTAGYEAAKYFCLNKQVEKALGYIEDIIDKDRYQSLKVIADPDIIKHYEVTKKLEQIKDKYIEKAKKLGSLVEKIMHKDSVFVPLFKKHQELIKEDTLLSARESIDIVSNKYIWSYLVFSKRENTYYYNDNENSIKKFVITHNGSNSDNYPLGVYRNTKNYDKQNIEQN